MIFIEISQFVLILFKMYTFESNDRKELYKRGDKKCINNMKQYFSFIDDFKEYTSFNGHNMNKDPNIFYFYYKIISEFVDNSDFTFNLPIKDIKDIQSKEEFNEYEIVKMKNLLCLLLYKIKDLDEEEFFLFDAKKDLLTIIKRIILISKENVIGNILMILIEKIIKNNDIEFNYTFFEDLKYHIHNYLIIIENYYSKYKINEYLRIIILKIKKLILNNKQLLLYNSYLNVENYLQNNKFYKSQKKIQAKNNLNEFIDDFFNIKDDKLQKYYDKPTTEEFIDNDQFIFSEYEDNDKKGDFSKNPKQVNAIINYMKEVSKDINDNYIEIIIDFISSKIYDCLINHKPDNEDIKLFNELIKDHLNYELDSKTDIEETVMKNIRFNMKKFEKLPGI